MARRTIKKNTKRYFRRIPVEYVASYSATLLRQIKDRLGGAISFTREDLLHLPIVEFEQVAFISRYRATCIAVSYLIEHGELVPKKFPDLCLPDQASRYRFDETSVSDEYAPTIRRLVSGMPGDKFAVMQVVQRWRTDPQLSQDSKRKAVRMALRRLVREGVCDKVNTFEYKVAS